MLSDDGTDQARGGVIAIIHTNFYADAVCATRTAATGQFSTESGEISVLIRRVTMMRLQPFRAPQIWATLMSPLRTFVINGQVNLNFRSMRCEPGAVLVQNIAQSQRMFRIYKSTNQSVFNCSFRGPNYNRNSPNYYKFPEDFLWIIPPTTGFRVVGNDFNGSGGYTGAIDVYAGDSWPNPATGTYIGYNSFEHCDYYAIQVTAGLNSQAEYNTSNDCAWWVEADDSGQINTGNVANNNHVTFTYGTGDSQFAGGGRFGSAFTCGHDASSAPYDYSGNYCKNNTVDGPYTSYLQMDASGTPARYCGNTCTGGCVTRGSQSSPPCP